VCADHQVLPVQAVYIALSDAGIIQQLHFNQNSLARLKYSHETIVMVVIIGIGLVFILTECCAVVLIAKLTLSSKFKNLHMMSETHSNRDFKQFSALQGYLANWLRSNKRMRKLFLEEDAL
jgi:hypothetical protein